MTPTVLLICALAAMAVLGTLDAWLRHTTPVDEEKKEARDDDEDNPPVACALVPSPAWRGAPVGVALRPVRADAPFGLRVLSRRDAGLGRRA